MAERFLKFIPSDEAIWLLKKKGHAFRLLSIIAEAARRYEGGPDGLKIGECFIGGHEKYDMTEQNYRTAKEILIKRQHVEIVETCRTRKKSTTGVTTVGTKVKILSTSVWDINSNDGNDRGNDCPTTDQRPTNDKLRRIKKEKKEKKSHHPQTPSKKSELPKLTDDFSSKIEICPGVFLTQEELDACLKLRGSREGVIEAIEFIQGSEKRRHPIADWPNALARWKIENKSQVHIKKNILYTENLCKEFQEFEDGRGWQCRMHNDSKKDQRGILFVNESPHQEAFFVPLHDGEIKTKCEDFIRNKNMREKH